MVSSIRSLMLEKRRREEDTLYLSGWVLAWVGVVEYSENDVMAHIQEITG